MPGLVVAVLSGFGLAAVAPAVCRAAGARAGTFLALLPAALAVWFASFVPAVAGGTSVRAAMPWVPSVGLTLAFSLDGLGLLFALLVTGIGALVLVYADAYLGDTPERGRFHAVLLAFMASMLGLVLADDAILLFVFWELTSFTSYLLIGFDHERPAARAAALQALLVTGSGGLAMLAGLVLLAQAGGTSELSALLARPDVVRAHPAASAILLLVLAGAFTKSAQVPFHFWLPSAMEAPTPVSAYLHSATMVKAGVYLLARLSPLFAGTGLWVALVGAVGAVTMLVGALRALAATDAKRILAHSTISVLGLLTMLLGVGTPGAVTAAIVYLLAHALYKGALFLVAGAVDHETGTRDVDRLGGLAGAMPVTAAAAAAAAFSMAGLPPTLGFVGKEAAYEAVLGSDAAGLATAAAVTAGAVLAAVAAIVGLGPFVGRSASTAPPPGHEAPVALWLGPLGLAGAGVVAGLAPATVAPVVDPAVAAVLGGEAGLPLALWHGATPALGLSVVTIVAGVGAWGLRMRLRRGLARAAPLARGGSERVYTDGVAAVTALADAQTRWLQNGYLRVYVLVVLVATVGLVGGALAMRVAFALPATWTSVRVHEAGLAVLTVAAALAAVRSTSRLGTIAALGVVGYGVALVYVLFGAPDLAMTQFMVETLLVILFVLVFHHLPGFARLSSDVTRVRDAVVATLVGALVTGLVLVSTRAHVASPLADYFARQSAPAAHGRNVVNVILVDFRALDTLGEIVVLAVAAVGVYALLKLQPRRS
jgi:multicomponent Na+:H+ antiporter subunit A